MIDRVVRLLLVVALALAGGSAPFAHVHPHRHDISPSSHTHSQGTEHPTDDHNQSAHHRGQGAHWHLSTHHPPTDPEPHPVVGLNDVHLSVTVSPVATERGSVRLTTAGVMALTATVVSPESRGQSVLPASDARPNPPPLETTSARGPPL